MGSYFLRRLLLVIPTFIGVTMVAFVVMHFVPGGPIERQIMQFRMAMAQGMDSPAARASMSASL